ncbi:YdcF family protein [Flavobacterium sp. ACAM 123]|uniref:YdcF family protein n=1 Tax=Flavobacterium sp. ACAM 123 TaxID=1189620 RepID=UPI0003121F15|nr:YdcF family protein [Flavobacterium sp. ACAM 123]
MNRILFITMAFVFMSLQAQKNKQFDINFMATSSNSVVQDKNFYLLTAIQKNAEVRKLLEDDLVLKLFYDRQQKDIEGHINILKDSLKSLVPTYKFKDEDLKIISSRLGLLLQKYPFFQNFVDDNIRPSGNYENFKNDSDVELLIKAWELCARGMNQIIEVYGLGKASQYAEIDSVSYDVKSTDYKRAVFMWSDFLQHKKLKESSLFFQPALDFSLSLLYLNHRDEAARYEPLAENENQKVAGHVINIDFDKYDYTCIVVLGNGPENYYDRLSALGKLNLQLGVLEYQAKKAPLIMLSGGHAHPFRPRFCEAIEMKKELMEVYKIPEENILIDPHARHTTTNLRNATRILVRNKIPISKPLLVVTNSSHSSYLGNKSFAARCMSEFGYLPAIQLKRLSNTTIEFLPKIESLHQNPIDPLDP